MKKIDLVLEGEKVSPQVLDHSSREEIPDWRVEIQVSRTVFVVHIAISSAYKEYLIVFGKLEKRSLIKRFKRRGLKTDPWGTPLVKGKAPEVVELFRTFNCLLVRKLIINLKRFPEKPKLESLIKRLL